ncbi:uncharacterized protein M421DRAFT_210614 [Didymella exigua CBS 183.55]|uniref:Uncharacterized protein n=1 Tax=Didymella exigua CBS 183.55 TaxID=1150837 RepID=A0A6A5RGH0_9PLEO|nr:uncharacterized protein M421DRAFT_210614 [Didymella exigua CBS 183.55]KAF1926573.1 hypothetical protein M421DRAFT_210614 [Didymella exigua CBS 183.55]
MVRRDSQKRHGILRLLCAVDKHSARPMSWSSNSFFGLIHTLPTPPGHPAIAHTMWEVVIMGPKRSTTSALRGKCHLGRSVNQQQLTKFETSIQMRSLQVEISQCCLIIGGTAYCDHRIRILIAASAATRIAYLRVAVCIDSLVIARCMKALQELNKRCRMCRAIWRQVRAQCARWPLVSYQYSSIVTPKEAKKETAIMSDCLQKAGRSLMLNRCSTS